MLFKLLVPWQTSLESKKLVSASTFRCHLPASATDGPLCVMPVYACFHCFYHLLNGLCIFCLSVRQSANLVVVCQVELHLGVELFHIGTVCFFNIFDILLELKILSFYCMFQPGDFILQAERKELWKIKWLAPTFHFVTVKLKKNGAMISLQ